MFSNFQIKRERERSERTCPDLRRKRTAVRPSRIKKRKKRKIEAVKRRVAIIIITEEKRRRSVTIRVTRKTGLDRDLAHELVSTKRARRDRIDHIIVVDLDRERPNEFVIDPRPLIAKTHIPQGIKLSSLT